MTTPTTTAPIFTKAERDRLRKAFKAIGAELPRCLNHDPLERAATAGDDTEETP